jgi:peptidoglycan/LPS O-acetylase OafA/YrhL
LLVVFVIVAATDNSLGLEEQWNYAHVFFGLAAALAFPGALIGHTRHRRILALGPIAWYGTLAYAIYLFHPFVLDAVDRLIGAGSDSLSLQLIRMVLVIVGSTGVAIAANRFYGDPINNLGHRFARASHRPGRVDRAATLR